MNIRNATGTNAGIHGIQATEGSGSKAAAPPTCQAQTSTAYAPPPQVVNPVTTDGIMYQAT